MSELRLRAAVVQDGAAIGALFLASRRDALPYLPKLHSDEEALRWIVDILIPTRMVWVAESVGRVVGFLAMKGEELEHLYVHPEYFRRGVGQQLLAKARELSPQRLHLLTFQRNSRARAFYEAHGFIATAFSDGSRNEEHEPDVKYEWTPASVVPPHK
ncbi:MAG: N-acetyltransferase family protein [Candidatus Binataceae bacterium]